MARTIIIYATVLAIAAAGLNWLQYRYFVQAFSTQIYVGLIAVSFITLGIWVGSRLTPRHAPSRAFVRNDAAIRSLGLSTREIEILGALASGQSNKELARSFDISPNTVKTHVARLYEKLGVQRRVQAIEKARLLAVIP
jgi:DNA-binding CsgD family transcriptional regulator